LGASVALMEGGFKYIMQLFMSLTTFGDFYPQHPSTKPCDSMTGGWDSMMANVTTLLAYLFIIPAVHLILKTFIPGLPKGVSFKESKHGANIFRWCKSKLSSDEEKGRELKNLQMVEFGGSKQRIEQEFGELDEEEQKLTKFSAAASIDYQIEKETPELPTFAEIFFLILSEAIQLESGALVNYVKALRWKLVQLVKLTFGHWDDELTRCMQLKMRAKKWDENPFDDEEYHGDMLSLIGTSHTLVWQFFSSTVILSKFAEVLNDYPLLIATKEELINIEPLISDGSICDKSKSFFQMVYDFVMFWKDELSDGRLVNAIFGIFKFFVTLWSILSPSTVVFSIFLAFSTPFHAACDFDQLVSLGLIEGSVDFGSVKVVPTYSMGDGEMTLQTDQIEAFAEDAVVRANDVYDEFGDIIDSVPDTGGDAGNTPTTAVQHQESLGQSPRLN
jgi:hypothetical protein